VVGLFGLWAFWRHPQARVAMVLACLAAAWAGPVAMDGLCQGAAPGSVCLSPMGVPQHGPEEMRAQHQRVVKRWPLHRALSSCQGVPTTALFSMETTVGPCGRETLVANLVALPRNLPHGVGLLGLGAFLMVLPFGPLGRRWDGLGYVVAAGIPLTVVAAMSPMPDHYVLPIVGLLVVVAPVGWFRLTHAWPTHPRVGRWLRVVGSLWLLHQAWASGPAGPEATPTLPKGFPDQATLAFVGELQAAHGAGEPFWDCTHLNLELAFLPRRQERGMVDPDERQNTSCVGPIEGAVAPAWIATHEAELVVLPESRGWVAVDQIGPYGLWRLPLPGSR
jgi:hypothetical protein